MSPCPGTMFTCKEGYYKPDFSRKEYCQLSHYPQWGFTQASAQLQCINPFHLSLHHFNRSSLHLFISPFIKSQYNKCIYLMSSNRHRSYYLFRCSFCADTIRGRHLFVWKPWDVNDDWIRYVRVRRWWLLEAVISTHSLSLLRERLVQHKQS